MNLFKKRSSTSGSGEKPQQTSIRDWGSRSCRGTRYFQAEALGQPFEPNNSSVNEKPSCGNRWKSGHHPRLPVTRTEAALSTSLSTPPEQIFYSTTRTFSEDECDAEESDEMTSHDDEIRCVVEDPMLL